MSTIGDRLRELRERKGLSQKGLSVESGVSLSLISRWETNKVKNINEDKLQQICDYFHVSPEYMMTGIEGNGLPPEVYAWFKEWIKSPANQQTIINLYKKDKKDEINRKRAMLEKENQKLNDL